MNADQTEIICRDLTEQVIGVFYDVYNELGHGFLHDFLLGFSSRLRREPLPPAGLRAPSIRRLSAALLREDRVFHV